MTVRPLETLYRDPDMDDVDVDQLGVRLAIVRKALPSMSAYRDDAGAHVLEGGGATLRLTPKGESVVSSFASTVDGRHVAFWLTMPIGRAAAETLPDAVAWLDAMEAVLARPRGGLVRVHGFQDREPAILGLAAALDDAIAVLLCENPDYPQVLEITLRSPCMGNPGQILDHRRNPLLAKPVEKAILARCASLGVISRGRAHFEVKPVEMQARVTAAHAGPVAASAAWRRIGIDRPKNGSLVKAGQIGSVR